MNIDTLPISALSKGDRIEHPQWGAGIVADINPNSTHPFTLLFQGNMVHFTLDNMRIIKRAVLGFPPSLWPDPASKPIPRPKPRTCPDTLDYRGRTLRLERYDGRITTGKCVEDVGGSVRLSGQYCWHVKRNSTITVLD
ncbi:MAG: hypothetical protein Q4A98_08670 [Comamonadaceae bacterium]|nr:hypothetical protein [Comamonadaceae bacterium]